MPSAPEASRAAFALLRGGGRIALDFLLPPQCLTCDAPVGAPGQLCAACFRRTHFIAEPCCHRCGLGLASAAKGGALPDNAKGGALSHGPKIALLACDACQAHPPVWDQARAALRYDDQAKRLLLPFKHGDRTELAAALAPMMARAGATLLARADVLVPVPLHRWRMLGRRYNQSALLARALSRLSGRPAVLDALLRHRPTAALGPLSPDRRRAALAGAIRVSPRRLPILVDARVLLIDDVLTTGATAEACTEALLGAGAGAVDILAGARVAPSLESGRP